MQESQKTLLEKRIKAKLNEKSVKIKSNDVQGEEIGREEMDSLYAKMQHVMQLLEKQFSDAHQVNVTETSITEVFSPYLTSQVTVFIAASQAQ